MKYIIFSCSEEEKEILNKSPYPPIDAIEVHSFNGDCLDLVYSSFHAFDEALKLIGRGMKDNANNIIN